MTTIEQTAVGIVSARSSADMIPTTGVAPWVRPPALTIAERRTAYGGCVSCDDVEVLYDAGVRLTRRPIPLDERHRVVVIARPHEDAGEQRIYRTPHHVCASHASDLPDLADVCRPSEVELLREYTDAEEWASPVFEVAAINESAKGRTN